MGVSKTLIILHFHCHAARSHVKRGEERNGTTFPRPMPSPTPSKSIFVISSSSFLPGGFVGSRLTDSEVQDSIQLYIRNKSSQRSPLVRFCFLYLTLFCSAIAVAALCFHFLVSAPIIFPTSFNHASIVTPHAQSVSREEGMNTKGKR